MLTHSFCPGVTRGLANLVFATSMMVTGLSSLPAMAAETLLTVVSGDGTETAFTRDRLESLPQHAFRTETQWTWEEKEFSGPLLTDVLAEVGISDGTVELVADDGYQVCIVRPAETFPTTGFGRERHHGPFWFRKQQ